MPKCRYCSKGLDKDDSEFITSGKSRIYFCNHEHYLCWQSQSKASNIITSTLCKAIDIKPPKNHYIYIKKVNTLLDEFKFENIMAYIESNNEHLNNTLDKKTFSDSYGRFCYAIAIIKSHINDKSEPEYVQPEINIEKAIVDVGEYKYRKRNKKSLLEKLEALEDE